MKNELEPIEALSDIRTMMMRSTRFISLNGLAGVFAGTFALMGAAVAYIHLGLGTTLPLDSGYTPQSSVTGRSLYIFVMTDALLVLFASLVVAILLSVRKARREGVKIWDHAGRRLTMNMLIPLAAGGLFCLVLLYHGLIGLVAPATLIFYGLALVNASKYTLEDIRYLGLIQIALGLLASVWIGYGLFFWALGFGVVHIIYGIFMYFKYER